MTQARSKPLSFPIYRRSHFRSQTYLALVRIFSHLPPTLDDGDGRMEQEKSNKELEFSEFVGSASTDHKDHVPEKIIQKVHKTTEGFRDKGMESGTNDVVLCDIERISKMDELMDYQVECAEFHHSKVKKSGNASDLQVQVTECKMTNEKKKGDMEDGELTSNSSDFLIEKGNMREGELARDFEMDGEYGSVLMPGNNEDKQIGSKRASHMPTNCVQSQVLHKALLEEEDKQDEGNSFASKQKVNISDEKRHGPRSEGRKAKRKGDKCQFSHDTVPLTKLKPCRHFARQSCMKGNNCPFDHELSKYPCDKFVSRGFCSRGDACLFSHQLPPKEDRLTPSGLCRPELKSPSLLGNASFSVPSNNRGCSSVQQTRSHIDPEDKVTEQKHIAPIPKGIRFINFAKSSSPSPSTTEQGLITPNKESLVHTGACSDQGVFGAHQTLGETPKKIAAVAPKGANFLCFGKGFMCGFESSISSLLNKENDIKVPQFVNFGLSNHAGSSVQNYDCNNCSPIYATIASPSMPLVSQFSLQRSS